MKQKRNYQFYFRYEKFGKKHIVIDKVCKSPTQTKVYKQLMNSLTKGFIHSFGYHHTQTENNFIKV